MNASQSSAAQNPGLCGECVHARRIQSDRSSVFYQCQLSFTDPRFVKYPRLPVLSCSGYRCFDSV
ncbi:MAG TPA: hypothetical protein VFE08_12915 [Candidatus Sulfotelmatobacter sp.]|nr:hypothetical protein [Candidatus Sulfotelmatobacter sp.]